jgi:hypothetical protein
MSSSDAIGPSIAVKLRRQRGSGSASIQVRE